jgi:hypothetical protein
VSAPLDAVRPTRREQRRDAVRIVEYTRFPRVGAGAGPRFAFTRDYSRTGMCIGCDEPEPVGALLRLAVRELDARASRPRLQRVVWCEPAGDGRYWLGLERVADD